MEENKTSVPMNERAVENDRDARAEELESTFSYDGSLQTEISELNHLQEKSEYFML